MTDFSPPDRAEVEARVAAKISEPGNYTCMPMTVNGIDYPRVFALSNASLRDLMAVRTQEFATRECLVYGEERMTYAEFWEKACRFANALITQYGVKPEDRVAIAMRNYPEWCIAYTGIILAGATVVPLNAWWVAEELTYSLKDCGAKIVICDAKRLGFLKPLHDEEGLTLILAREEADGADARLEQLIAGADAAMPQVQINADSDFCILYTSGSTGKPKGVQLTHRSVISALLSWGLLLEVIDELRPDLNLRPDNRAVLVALPLFHVTASHTSFVRTYLGGFKMVFMYKWDARDAIELINREQITNVTLVPTQSFELVNEAGPDELPTLRDIGTGGAKRPAKHVKQMEEKFPEITASSGYGLTETNALGCYNALQDYRDRPDSTGREIPPVTQIKIFDEDMNELPAGETGEICIKSPANFRGYLNMPEETAKVLTADGWFRTGDLGYIDEDDFVYVVDRLKDLIIRGGENISCLEVENALYAIEGVREATVFGIPDEKMGEIVGAVVFTDGVEIDLQTVCEELQKHLAGFKVPERIWLSPQALPRGNTDKVDKRMTRKIALSHPPHYSR